MAHIPPIILYYFIKQTLKGYRKNFPSKDNCRLITLEILESLCHALPNICTSEYESTLFMAAFTLAFFAALRISEMVAPNKNSPSNLKILDIIMSQNLLKIFIH